MYFKEVDKAIPKNVDGDLHSVHKILRAPGTWRVETHHPGKYAPTDFAVVVTARPWDRKKFKHSEAFRDIERKHESQPGYMIDWFEHALRVCKGAESAEAIPQPPRLPGVNIRALNYALLALAVCENRRYGLTYAIRGGGRYLPINFIGAILEGKWSAEEASESMRTGLPALYKIGYSPFTHNSNPSKFIERFRIHPEL